MKRKKTYSKKRSSTRKRRRKSPAAVGAITQSGMINQFAGVAGAATAASSDAVFQRIEFLKDQPIKVNAARGLIGWILANNPTKTPQLSSPMLSEYGKGMMYYAWGQMVNYGLKLEGYVNKAVGVQGIDTPEAVEVRQEDSFISSVDYYDMIEAEYEEGENAELAGVETNNKLMV